MRDRRRLGSGDVLAHPASPVRAGLPVRHWTGWSATIGDPTTLARASQGRSTWPRGGARDREKSSPPFPGASYARPPPRGARGDRAAALGGAGDRRYAEIPSLHTSFSGHEDADGKGLDRLPVPVCALLREAPRLDLARDLGADLARCRDPGGTGSSRAPSGGFRSPRGRDVCVAGECVRTRTASERPQSRNYGRAAWASATNGRPT
jgi:hypothetical protein